MSIAKAKRILANGCFPVRSLVLKILRATQRDVSMRHPYSNLKFRLNTYKHKGYWYYGKSREKGTMDAFGHLISKGDVVFDVGGHIGFVSHYFSVLVGAEGQVIVFEPGANNLPYTRANTAVLNNARLVEKGCSNANSIAPFYEDGLLGQNNSLLCDYSNVETVAKSHNEEGTRTVRDIETVRLCDFIDTEDIMPDFIKIDVEGKELDVLQGLGCYAGKIKKMMIEVTENHSEVFDLLVRKGYSLFDGCLGPIDRRYRERGNVFAIVT